MSEQGWQADGTYVPCPECRWTPPPDRIPVGTPVRMPGVTHRADCPSVQFMTAAQQRDLLDHLIEMNRRRRRAAAELATFVIF